MDRVHPGRVRRLHHRGSRWAARFVRAVVVASIIRARAAAGLRTRVPGDDGSTSRIGYVIRPSRALQCPVRGLRPTLPSHASPPSRPGRRARAARGVRAGGGVEPTLPPTPSAAALAVSPSPSATPTATARATLVATRTRPRPRRPPRRHPRADRPTRAQALCDQPGEYGRLCPAVHVRLVRRGEHHDGPLDHHRQPQRVAFLTAAAVELARDLTIGSPYGGAIPRARRRRSTSWTSAPTGWSACRPSTRPWTGRRSPSRRRGGRRASPCGPAGTPGS